MEVHFEGIHCAKAVYLALKNLPQHASVFRNSET